LRRVVVDLCKPTVVAALARHPRRLDRLDSLDLQVAGSGECARQAAGRLRLFANARITQSATMCSSLMSCLEQKMQCSRMIALAIQRA
jgi:hypothetical protein